MGTILSLEFRFRGCAYYALDRVKAKDSCREHHITVMDGDLERMLYGNHIIVERDGQFDMTLNSTSTEEGRLRLEILKALSDHYNEKNSASK